MQSTAGAVQKHNRSSRARDPDDELRSIRRSQRLIHWSIFTVTNGLVQIFGKAQRGPPPAMDVPVAGL
jgi:hypothetical protein